MTAETSHWVPEHLRPTWTQPFSELFPALATYRSFLCVNVPEVLDSTLCSLDYLDPSLPKIVRVMIYSLGLLAHEFVHRLQVGEVMDRYKPVAQQTWGVEGNVWSGYPSEYAKFYSDQEEPDEELVLKEDLADSVQIYVMNSTYLQQHYPERFAFIQKEFAHLVPDSARAAVLSSDQPN